MILAGALALGLGTILLYLSIPVVISSFLLIPGTPVLEHLQPVGERSLERLDRVIDSRRAALRWDETGRSWTDLGLAHLLSAKAAESDVQRRHYEQAERALTRGLALAPANPYAWVRLAYVRFALEGRSSRVASAVRMAIMTGPYERGLAFIRLELALHVWNLIAEPDRDLLAQQVRFAWKLDPARVVRLAHTTNRTMVARKALRATSGALERFDRLEQQLRQGSAEPGT